MVLFVITVVSGFFLLFSYLVASYPESKFARWLWTRRVDVDPFSLILMTSNCIILTPEQRQHKSILLQYYYFINMKKQEISHTVYEIRFLRRMTFENLFLNSELVFGKIVQAQTVTPNRRIENLKLDLMLFKMEYDEIKQAI